MESTSKVALVGTTWTASQLVTAPASGKSDSSKAGIQRTGAKGHERDEFKGQTI